MISRLLGIIYILLKKGTVTAGELAEHFEVSMRTIYRDIEQFIDFSDWSGRRQQLFEQIRQSILERRVMEFDYYGQYGEMTHRIVEPVQLLFNW